MRGKILLILIAYATMLICHVKFHANDTINDDNTYQSQSFFILFLFLSVANYTNGLTNGDTNHNDMNGVEKEITSGTDAKPKTEPKEEEI